MLDRRVVVLLACSVPMATSTNVNAQRLGGPEPRAGACFYEDVDFGGNYFCLRTGETLDSVPSGMNDRISSVRTFGGAQATVFRDFSFHGTSARFDYDVANLKPESWNDRISSVQVQRGSDDYRGQPRNDRSYGRSRRYTQSADRVVRRAYEDMLGREPDPEGLEHYRSRILDYNWSEADVREDLRKSTEYRQRASDEYRGQYGLSRGAAEDIVRRAYRSVLNREPDPASAGYVERVLRDGWSQEDVERELRQSAEYRNRNR
jgi:hypothetical protein